MESSNNTIIKLYYLHRHFCCCQRPRPRCGAVGRYSSSLESVSTRKGFSVSKSEIETGSTLIPCTGSGGGRDSY